MDKVSEITGLVIEINKMKMAAASMNIANADATTSSFDSIYKKISVDVQGIDSLSGYLVGDRPLNDSIVTRYIESEDVKRRYDPNNSLADPYGFVYSANIDHTEQMLDVQTSKRIYEVGLKIYQMNIDMNTSVLRLGK